jgi:WhiB family transcriptional regulator, redox-sensing transcriptional regulator
MATRRIAVTEATADDDWQRRGACRNHGELFYEDGDTAWPRARREAWARALCGRCPVRARCAAQALRRREPHGIWGGFTELDRRRLQTIGWEDVADRCRGSVDVATLDRRLRSPRSTVDPRVGPNGPGPGSLGPARSAHGG